MSALAQLLSVWPLSRDEAQVCLLRPSQTLLSWLVVGHGPPAALGWVGGWGRVLSRSHPVVAAGGPEAGKPVSHLFNFFCYNMRHMAAATATCTEVAGGGPRLLQQLGGWAGCCRSLGSGDGSHIVSSFFNFFLRPGSTYT